MKIIIEDPMEGEEEKIIIRCRTLDEKMMAMIYGIKMDKKKIIGSIEDKIYMLNPDEVYYFEAVDNKVFIYCKEKIYETKLKLYEIEKEYDFTDFFRVSKSTVLNLSEIVNITPAFNGRFEAILNNGEKVIISRQYVAGLKRKLGV